VVRVVTSEGFVDVLTGDGIYRLYELSDDDSAATMPASTVVRSVKDTLGLAVASLLERLTAVERELLDLRGAHAHDH
jgi:hypothetical protein